jgi:hypothetical protein
MITPSINIIIPFFDGLFIMAALISVTLIFYFAGSDIKVYYGLPFIVFSAFQQDGMLRE